MRVTILGSGTSAGVPTPGCTCDVCLSTNPLNKRMRASIFIEQGATKLLVDCGPDLRTQVLTFGVNDISDVLLTHTHADHLNGLDDLRSFNMIHGHAIDLYGTSETLDEVKKRFAYCFQPPPPGGGIPQLELNEFTPGTPFRIDDLDILPLTVMHGQWAIVGFRINDLGYFTDVSFMPDATVEALQGVKVLITSALRHRPHPTHMNLAEAVKLSRRIGARQTWFTHMSHDLEHEATNRDLPPGVALLYDGLSFDV